MPFLVLSFLCLLIMSTALASVPDPSSYWQPRTPIDYTDPLNAGFPSIPSRPTEHILIYNGTALNRTYTHHPHLYVQPPKITGENSTVYLVYTSGFIDEDSMGNEVWGTVSTDGGFTWGESRVILPSPILPNQTFVPGGGNYSFWCEQSIWQRAFGALTVAEIDGTVYAFGETTNRYCFNGGSAGSGTKGAGRVARPIALAPSSSRLLPPSLTLLSDPCWVTQNNYTTFLLYPLTVYGTSYHMRTCPAVSAITAYLDKPQNVPAWSDWVYNNILASADEKHSMQENTHAVWIEDEDEDAGGYWQRFWRDITGGTASSKHVFVETTLDPLGGDWYPVREETLGNTRILETTFPDVTSKGFLGTFNHTGNDDLESIMGRYFVSNPRNNSESIREPLTIAVSYGKDLAYRDVGVLRTNASTNIVSDTRGGVKRRGFQYPTAVQVGDNLVVAYSENKENLWVSVVPLSSLPGMSSRLPSSTGAY